MKLELDDNKRNKHSERIGKLKGVIHKLAYGSLVLDICIAIITSFSLFQISVPGELLIPVNLMLTIVVILSIGSAILIITRTL